MIRKAEKSDAVKLAPLVKKLWPEHSAHELIHIIGEYTDKATSCVYVYENGEDLIGTALCCLRNDYVEGCDTSPVGYLEGVFVEEAYRRQGIACALVKECEKWAKEKGCSEFASDCELTNTTSLSFHLNIGFEEENRLICFKKHI